MDIELCFDGLTYDEKLELIKIWEGHSKVLLKLKKVSLAYAILNEKITSSNDTELIRRSIELIPGFMAKLTKMKINKNNQEAVAEALGIE